MAVFNDQATVSQIYQNLFGFGVPLPVPANFFVGLLDESATEVTANTTLGTRFQISAGAAGWQAYDDLTACDGTTTAGVGNTGVQNVGIIDFGVLGIAGAVEVRYVSLFDALVGGTEIFRNNLGTTINFIATQPVLIPAGGLKVGSEYII